MTPYNPSVKSQQVIVDFLRSAAGLHNSQWNLRTQLRQIDLSYLRETDFTEEQVKAKRANRVGDANKFQNVVLPVVLPQVEAAVTYQQSVFLTGYPIFSCVAPPEFADQASQMDTIIGEQQDKGNWVHEHLMCLRDGFKYNLMAMEVDWRKEVTYSLATDTTYQDGKQGRPTEVLWEGNKLKRLDLYNTFWDTRVNPRDVATKGEFAGYNEIMSQISLKQFVAGLPSRMNMTAALNSGFDSIIGSSPSTVNGYYSPQLNPDAVIDFNNVMGTNWVRWMGFSPDSSKTKYRDVYQVTTIYVRLLPSDFGFNGVPGPNTPQVWKFIVVNNQVVIYCERLSNAHNMLPIIFAQPLDDGLGYQTKSFATNVMPFQELTTALSNSTIAARRRAISDRMLFDPSRVSPGAINNDSPTARIPVRPTAYGQELAKAIYPIPFRDDQFAINMQEIQAYRAMANEISGLNPVRQGQFVKGNKTNVQFDNVMQNANGRDQTVALTLEGNFFQPIKMMIKLNILQYQGGTTIFNREAGALVTIDPVMLRKANLVMKVSDGLDPSTKLINGDVLQVATQAIATSPQLASEYNVGDMYAYLFQSSGVKLSQFKKSPQQVAYEQATAQWQNAVAGLAAALEKGNAPPGAVEAMSQIMSTQPRPEQYGYVPGTKTLTPGAATTPGTPSLLSQMAAVVQQGSQTPQAPAAPAEGTQQ